MERSYAFSVSGGAGGHGTRISTASYGSRFGSSLGTGGYESYQSLGSVSGSGSGSSSGSFTIGTEKATMQHLNDRMANYLETVRDLERANSKLEIKIREALEKSGPDFRDYSKYQAVLDDLRKKVSG